MNGTGHYRGPDARRPGPEEDRPDRVVLGLDRILSAPDSFPDLIRSDSGESRGRPRRVGLVTSEGSAPGDPGMAGATARSALLGVGVPLTRLFAPEHGLSARTPDGVAVEDGTDDVTGIPVTSLYGPRFAPPPPIVSDLDLLLFDLQDVGARFYTFLWTLSHLMEVCAACGTPLWVLDRPNPLGGDPGFVEGPLPEPGAPPSLLGRWSIPVRHSLTLGEMALLLREEMGLPLELEVVRMTGWRRHALWPETGLALTPPSPGLPTFASILLYPGLAFLEATNLFEGRGTELSFRWFGAPWIDSEMAAEAVNNEGFPGLRAHPREIPQQGVPCPGVWLEVTEPKALRPVATGLRLLALVRALWPGEFRWSPYPTVSNPGGLEHFLRLSGSSRLSRILSAFPSLLPESEAVAFTRAPGWWERASRHLLYT